MSSERRAEARDMVWARRVVWERLMTTARADADLGDWMADNADRNEASMRRLEKACHQVAESIEHILARMPKRVP